jgi:hypothetical protein
MIKINGHDMDPCTCNWCLVLQVNIYLHSEHRSIIKYSNKIRYYSYDFKGHKNIKYKGKKVLGVQYIWMLASCCA